MPLQPEPWLRGVLRHGFLLHPYGGHAVRVRQNILRGGQKAPAAFFHDHQRTQGN